MVKKIQNNVKTKNILKALLIAATVAISFYYIAHTIISNAEALLQAQANVSYAMLLCSIGITTVCVFLGGWEWQLLLTALGHEVGVRQGLRIHLIANVAKYVPGFVWQIVGKAYLCHQAHVPRRHTTVAIGFEFVSIISTGLLAALVTLPGSGLMTMSLEERWAVYGLAALMGGVVFLGLPLGLQAGINVLYRDEDWKIRWGLVSLALVAMFLTWLLWGVGFCSLVAALYPVRSAQVPTFIFTLAASFVFSLLIIFVPTGIGVRESAMTFLLSTALPPSIAALTAILTRLVLVVGEVIGFVVALRL